MNPWSRRRAGAIAAERRPHVLLIEDDLALGRMLTWELEKRGTEAVLDGSCAEARRAAESTRFDLMLVDADLPDGDGVRLAEHLADTRGNTTVVIYSGRHGIRGTCGQRPAAHAVLTKPVRVWEILAFLPNPTPPRTTPSTERGGTPLAQWLRSGSSPARRAPRGASDAGVGGKTLRIERVETDIEADDPDHPAASWVDRVTTASPGSRRPPARPTSPSGIISATASSSSGRVRHYPT